MNRVSRRSIVDDSRGSHRLLQTRSRLRTRGPAVIAHGRGGCGSLPAVVATTANAQLPEQIAAIDRPHRNLWTLYLLRALLTGPAFPIVVLLGYFRYHTMRYRFDAQGVHMRWGLLFRRSRRLERSAPRLAVWVCRTALDNRARFNRPAPPRSPTSRETSA